MADNPVEFTEYILKKLNIKYKSSKLKDIITSHPSYPSLLSLSDTLEEFSVKNVAIKLNNDHIDKIDVPYITQISENSKNIEPYFVFIRKVSNGSINYDTPFKKNVIENYNDFKKKWTGKTLIFTVNEETKQTEKNEKLNLSEVFNYRNTLITVVLLFIFCVIYLTVADGKWNLLYLMGLHGIGFYLTLLLLITKFGKSYSLLDKVCEYNKNSSCENVLKSSASKLFSTIELSEVSLIYFMGGLFSVMFNLFNSSSSTIFYIYALSSSLIIPYSVYLIYYQKKILKQWCPLCMGVHTVIGLEFLILVHYLFNIEFASLDMRVLFSIFISYLLASLIWLLGKPYFEKSQEVLPLKKEIRALKRNSSVFNVLLNNSNDIEIKPFKTEIELGNLNDPLISILVVNNPFCSPCAKTHKEIEKLLLAYPEEVKVIVRFTGSLEKLESKRGKISCHLISLYNKTDEKKYRIALNEWYENMNFENWLKKYETYISKEIENIYIKHIKWCKRSNIKHTPTILLNNKKLNTNYYSIDDLRLYIKDLRNEYFTEFFNY